MALLRPAEDGWTAEDWQVFVEERAGIVEFDGGRRDSGPRRSLAQSGGAS